MCELTPSSKTKYTPKGCIQINRFQFSKRSKLIQKTPEGKNRTEN